MRRSVLILGGLAALGIAGQAQDSVVIDGALWANDEVGSVTIEGACEINPERVGCWNHAGKADSELSEKVRKYFVERSLNAPVSYGKKIRHVIVSWKPVQPTEGFNLRIRDARRDVQVSRLSPPKTEGAIWGSFFVEMAPDAKDIEVNIDATKSSFSEDFTLPMKKGEKAVVGDSSVEVTRVERVSKEKMSTLSAIMGAGNQGWRVHVKPQNVRLNYLNMKNRFVTSEGASFTVIDEKGIPKPDLKWQPGSSNPRAMLRFSMDPLSGEQWFETNVEPSQMAPIKFAVQTNKPMTVVFRGIPAEPKVGTF